MTVVLHLGVLDVSYRKPTAPPMPNTKGKVAKDKLEPPSALTTGDVAQILEEDYHVIELFVEEVGYDKITQAIEHSIDDAIADLFSGDAPLGSVDPTYAATSEIEEAFRLFIDLQQMDGVQPGVPTQAALKGVNHRLLHPYASSNPARPSFKDTGLYEASFMAWFD